LVYCKKSIAKKWIFISICRHRYYGKIFWGLRYIWTTRGGIKWFCQL